ncbi:MAG: MFS transporter [Paracoccus sp. (in: a-proteobacteria)]|uniref:MFS transporter n=1 Tax=Paracoccus sp. TaxID=267 RepID=UPI0026E04C02|nr:MFS transporter [Paracoccus sp. (in: a-proteobacteria)]MDO5621258.1 MFS transporter [Paracoccus sp. (in: a-proteobacteria)]
MNRFLIASGCANFGDGVALVAWGWLATQLTRDPLWIAMVPVALKAPWFVFSLPAGIIVDRLDRRRLMMAADGLRALAYLIAGLAVWFTLPLTDAPLRGTDYPALFALIAACAVVVGLAEVLRDTAAQTMLPALVPPDDLERANARLWTIEIVMNTGLGTAAAGVLLGLSLALPFGVNAAAMALAVALMATIAGQYRAQPATPPARASWRAELREGIGFLLANPTLRQLALLTGFFNFAFEAVMVSLVLIVQERLEMGPLALSAIMMAGAAGGVLAGLTGERIIARLGRGRTLQWVMLFALPLPLMIWLAGPGIWGVALVALGFFISELGGVLWNTIVVAWRQRLVPPALLGRVNSAYRLFAIGMAPVGMLAAGLLIRAVGDGFGRGTGLIAPSVMAFLVMGLLTLAYWRFLHRAFGH